MPCLSPCYPSGIRSPHPALPHSLAQNISCWDKWLWKWKLIFEWKPLRLTLDYCSQCCSLAPSWYTTGFTDTMCVLNNEWRRNDNQYLHAWWKVDFVIHRLIPPPFVSKQMRYTLVEAFICTWYLHAKYFFQILLFSKIVMDLCVSTS